MNDRDIRLLSSLTDMSDDLIEESLLPPAPPAAKSHRKRGRFSDFMSSPLAAAVLSGIVALAVLVAIIAAGQRDPTATPGGHPTDFQAKPFYVGMPYEDMLEELDSILYRDSFVYGGVVFAPRLGDQFLLMTCALTDEGVYAITDIRIYTEKTPSHEDFAKIEAGMDIHEVTSLVGRPKGSETSGMSSLSYRTADGDLYYIYLHGEGGTVSEVVWTNPDPVLVWVTFPEGSGKAPLCYTDPEQTARFHDHFKNLYTTRVYDTLPSDPTPFTCSVTIIYENGKTSLYRIRGPLLSRDGGETWAKIQEYQPHVDTPTEELIESAAADQTAVAFLRVEWIGEDGFCCRGRGFDGNVYIKAPAAYELFDTVRIEYYPALLQKQEGYVDGGPAYQPNYTYSLVIEQPVSIRLSDPDSGEPVYK